MSSEALYSTSSTLISLLGAILADFPHREFTNNTVIIIKNISLTMMRHIISLKQPIIEFYELDPLVGLLEILTQTILLLKKLYLKPLQTAIAYIIQYSSFHAHSNSSVEEIEGGSKKPTKSPLEMHFSRITGVCIELLASFSAKELQPVLITVAMGTPYISDCKELLKVFAYHLVVSFLFTFDPETQTLIDTTGAYLSFLIPASFFLSIRHKYSIELSDSCTSSEANINTRGGKFIMTLLSLFKQYSAKIHYEINFLKSNKSNPWQSFQYYLIYFLYTKNIYVDETDLVLDFDQTKTNNTGLLKRTTKAYTQSVRELFEGEMISLPLICTMLRENNPMIMFLQPYVQITEYILVFGDRASSAKQLNILYNLISKKFSALTQLIAKCAVLIDSVIITFYIIETLLFSTAETANYCFCPMVIQLFNGNHQQSKLKTPEKSGSCMRISSCISAELNTCLQILTMLLSNDQHITDNLRLIFSSILSSASFYSSVLSFSYGRLYSYPFALGILGSYCTKIPLFIDISESTIVELHDLFEKTHSFTNLTKIVKELYETFARKLIIYGYINTNHLKSIIYGMHTIFFHRCFTVHFFLKVISISIGKTHALHLNDLPVLSVKTIVERAPIMSYISKSRLISQLYLLLIYGYTVLDQVIMVYFYSRKYHECLKLTCQDFFSIVSDELTRRRMLETDFGKHNIELRKQMPSSTHNDDLLLDDLSDDNTALFTSDVYASLTLLRAESTLVFATEAILYTPQNWSALLFGSRTFKQFMHINSGLDAFGSYIYVLLQRPDIFVFTYTVLLICEILCCDAGKLHGHFTFILDHEHRVTLMNALRPSLEMLVGNFTDISVTNELQYSLSSSLNGCSTEFVIGLLNALELVCQPIVQDINPILLNRIALIKASIYKVDYMELSENLLIQSAVISGAHQLIDWTVSSREKSMYLLVSTSSGVQCPFHSIMPELSLHTSLARASYNYTLCCYCVSDIVSYKMQCTNCHNVRIVSLCDVFSYPLITQSRTVREQSTLPSMSFSYESAFNQAITQEHSLSAAINLRSFSVKIYGSLDIRIAMNILTKLSGKDALSNYTFLLNAVANSTKLNDLSWLGTIAHLHGNILRALFFSHAAALSVLEVSKSVESNKAQWTKTLISANLEMEKCATQLLPAFIGSWKGLLDPKYSMDTCTHLLTETLKGGVVSGYESIQPEILEIYKLLTKVASMATESIENLPSVDSTMGRELVFSLTILGTLAIPRTGISDLGLLIVSLTLIVGLLNDLFSYVISLNKARDHRLDMQLKDFVNAIASLQSLHLTLYFLPFSQAFGAIVQTQDMVSAKQTLDSVITYGCQYFSNLFTSPEAIQELSTILFSSDASRYFPICIEITYILRQLSQIPIKLLPSKVILNTDSTFYRIPFDHSPLFAPGTIVSRIHAGMETKLGSQRHFLIDPLGDLKRTRERMKELMVELPGNWDGLFGDSTGESAGSKRPLALLKETADGVFFFAGHGCGEAVLPLNFIAELQQLPFCLFMGCSSLTHIPVGQRYEIGTYQYYSSSPLMLGTLWDGISGELDNITAYFMKQWTKGERGMYSCLSEAIAGSSLRYLVGYSIIIIGDPDTKYSC